jgi:hypothetical protein
MREVNGSLRLHTRAHAHTEADAAVAVAAAQGALRFREKSPVREWEGRRRRERYLGRRGLGPWLAVLACRHRGEATRPGSAGARESAEQQHASAAEQAAQRQGGCCARGAQPWRRDKGGGPGKHDHQQQRRRQRTSDHRLMEERRRAAGGVASFPHHPSPTTTTSRVARMGAIEFVGGISFVQIKDLCCCNRKRRALRTAGRVYAILAAGSPAHGGGRDTRRRTPRSFR